jgi:hypothetical protein
VPTSAVCVHVTLPEEWCCIRCCCCRALACGGQQVLRGVTADGQPLIGLHMNPGDARLVVDKIQTMQVGGCDQGEEGWGALLGTVGIWNWGTGWSVIVGQCSCRCSCLAGVFAGVGWQGRCWGVVLVMSQASSSKHLTAYDPYPCLACCRTRRAAAWQQRRSGSAS